MDMLLLQIKVNVKSDLVKPGFNCINLDGYKSTYQNVSFDKNKRKKAGSQRSIRKLMGDI